jgi:hypothetical protein
MKIATLISKYLFIYDASDEIISKKDILLTGPPPYLIRTKK